MDELPYRLLSGALLIGAMAIGAPHRHRADREGGRVSRKGEGATILIGLRLAGLAVWLTMLCYVVAPGLVSWGAVPLPWWLRVSGAALAAAILAWLYWVFRSLGLNVTDTVAVRDGGTLVTWGPYGWVRHPLYAAVPGVVVSFGLIAANWFIVVAGGVVVGFLVVRTRIEERNLEARFGVAYEQYKRRTGRFLPRIRRSR